MRLSGPSPSGGRSLLRAGLCRRSCPPQLGISLYFQVLQPHRQLANALAGGVEEHIADRRIGAEIAEFAKALDAGRIDLVVLLAL